MGVAEAFRGQRYKEIKKKLIAEKKLFNDPEFPPQEVSLYFSPPAYSDIEWKRPGELVPDPHLFVEGVSSDDVTQGILGNCWFVAACSALTHHKELWTKVIPDAKEQEWDPAEPGLYCGIFRFSFWQFGHWVDVVVDDLLPTRNGQLLFARSKTRNEFWSALLEKAFAKLHGCYEALIGGSLAEAFVDITGGVPETVDLTGTEWKLSDSRSQLFDQLQEYFENGALMATAIAAKSQAEVEEVLDCGLVKGHSYAITEVRKLALDAELQSIFDKMFKTPEKVLMIRLRNPWGEKEWSGAWSDSAPEWKLISEDQRMELGLKIEEDGEFWMTFDDFCHNFTDISICHQVNTSWFSFSKSYHENQFFGLWTADHSQGHLTHRAGGCVNFKDTFLQNPQYRFDVPEDGGEVIMFSLMQRDVRERKRQGIRYLTIGMHVMKVEENRKFRLHKIQKAAGTSEYVNTRSVFIKLKDLKPGRYVVLPTTFAPGDEGEFLLRIYSTYDPSIVDLRHEDYCTSPPEPAAHPKREGGLIVSLLRQIRPSRLPPLSYTSLCVREATGLSVPFIGTSSSSCIGLSDSGKCSVAPYVYLECEGKKVRSLPVKGSYNPVWDFSVLFFRRKPDKPIRIDIYNDSSMLKDAHLGTAFLDAPVKNASESLELPLRENSKRPREGALKSGKLFVEVATYDNPIEL